MIEQFRKSKYLRVVVLFLAMCWLYRRFLETGHDWGDDFALYINQARSLVRGDVAQVISDNRYALENSGANSFSPYVYPWGLPILLAPVYLVKGIDYSAFAWVTVGSFVLFLFGFHTLIRRRIGVQGSLIITSVIAVAVPYVSWTASVTSDMPAIASVVWTLVWIDRCLERGMFVSGERWPLVCSGLLVAWSFSVRRELISLGIALFVVHIFELARLRKEVGTDGGILPRDQKWGTVLSPYWSAAGAIIGLQLMLPASLTQQGSGGGIGVIGDNLSWYQNVLAEQLGLRDIGAKANSLLGFEGLATIVMAVIVITAIAGLWDAAVARERRDLLVVSHVVAAAAIVLIQPFHEGRYLFGFTPYVLYFSWRGWPFVVDRAGSVLGKGTRADAIKRFAPVVICALLLTGHVPNFLHSLQYHLDYDYVVQGPETASAQEMFDAVKKCTRGDDVIMFARARAMNLYTGRKSVQMGNQDLALQRSDWMVVTNDEVNYYEPPINERNRFGLGLERAWFNDEFTLYRVNAPAKGASVACPSM